MAAADLAPISPRLADGSSTALGDRAVGMDGVYLSRRELRRLGREQRKGGADMISS